MPQRIQLRRAKGWRKPDHVVVVSRPSRWGNPFRLGVDGDLATCVERYRRAVLSGELGYTLRDVRAELAGRDLACWCPPDLQCHADVLLVLANDAGAANHAGPAGNDGSTGDSDGGTGAPDRG